LTPADGSRTGGRSGWRWLIGLAAALVSGGLMATCYWPLEWHFVGWFALVPLLLMLPRVSGRTAALCGLAFGLMYYRLTLGWVCDVVGPMGWAVIGILSVWMAVAVLVGKRLTDRFGLAAMLWAAPLALTGQEILRSEGLALWRFAYAGFGYSQAGNPWAAQMASLGGVYLVTLAVAAVNAALAYAVLATQRRQGWTAVLAVVAAVTVAATAGGYELGRPAGYVMAAAVQTEDADFGRHFGLIRQALGTPTHPKIVVLPEHALVDVYSEEHEAFKRLSRIADRRDVYICVGADIGTTSRPAASCPFDNTAVLFGPDGQILSRQAKVVPVPMYSDGNPAAEQVVAETQFGRIGTCICYDADFTDVCRRPVAMGARLLLIPIMNPKDWPAQQRHQQAAMIPFRCIELRRAAVCAASSGISQIIDPRGKVVDDRTQEEGDGFIVGSVPLRDDRTVFVRGGYMFARVVGWGYLGLIAVLVLTDAAGIFQRGGSRDAAKGERDASDA